MVLFTPVWSSLVHLDVCIRVYANDRCCSLGQFAQELIEFFHVGADELDSSVGMYAFTMVISTCLSCMRSADTLPWSMLYSLTTLSFSSD